MKSNSWLMSYVIDGLLGFILFRCSSYILHTPEREGRRTVLNLFTYNSCCKGDKTQSDIGQSQSNVGLFPGVQVFRNVTQVQYEDMKWQDVKLFQGISINKYFNVMTSLLSLYFFKQKRKKKKNYSEVA